VWARPGRPSPATEPSPQAESPTTQLPPGHGEPQGDRPHEPPAQPDIAPGAQGYPAAPPYGQPPSEDIAGPVKTKRRFLGDPVSIVLVLVIVVALLIAGVIGAELYARNRADNVVAAAAECEVQDKVTVSFGPSPFLLQHIAGHYNDISIHTAGNQLRSAKGMTANININDVDLHGNANSKGTIGALDATITWTSNGIKETVQDSVPFVGGLVNSVTTNPSAGTVELSGALGLGSVTVKPQVAGNGLSLQVTSVTAMGTTVPRETAQSALDTFNSKLTKDYPLGIHADSVQVTNDGVLAHFSTRNASIPVAQTNPCFAHI
jgi:LmeA-like phospholipid-binding